MFYRLTDTLQAGAVQHNDWLCFREQGRKTSRVTHVQFGNLDASASQQL